MYKTLTGTQYIEQTCITRTQAYNTSATLQGYNDTSIHLLTHFLWVNHSSAGTYYPILVPSPQLGLGQNLTNVLQQTTCAKVCLAQIQSTDHIRLQHVTL